MKTCTIRARARARVRVRDRDRDRVRVRVRVSSLALSRVKACTVAWVTPHWASTASTPRATARRLDPG